MIFLSIAGILSHRWQILFKVIVGDPAKVTNLVRAMVVLHNFLRTVNDTAYTPPGFTDAPLQDGTYTPGFWRVGEQRQLANTDRVSRSTSVEAGLVRTKFVNFFQGTGSVSWQVAHVNRR